MLTREVVSILSVALFLTGAGAAGAAEGKEGVAEAEVRQASDRFYTALDSMFTGDMKPMEDIWSHAADVTDMGPFGGREMGWDAVQASFAGQAKRKLGGHVVCKDLLVRASGDFGYTLCNEHGKNMTAAGKPIVVEHRATNVFRRENGQWKLVHHHTDINPTLQRGLATKKPARKK